MTQPLVTPSTEAQVARRRGDAASLGSSSLPAAYLIATGGTIVACVARFALNRVWGHENPLVILILPVAASAWYGGLKPALVALVLNLLAGRLFFVEPVHSLAPPSAPDQLRLLLFTVAGLCVAAVGEAGQRRQRRLQQAIQQQRQGEELFRTMADSIPQLAWMARPDGEVFWYNQRWNDYTGMPPEQMKGWGWRQVHDPAELARVTANWKKALAEGREWEDIFPLRRHDGAMRWHLSRALPVRNELGKVVQWFGTNTDITERLEMENALKQADQRKDEFLATLAHELRNPLAPLRNSLHVVRLAGGNTELINQAYEVMERQIGQLVRLIDDLLDVSRITRGKLELRKERVKLAALIENAIEIARPLIDAHGHHFTVALPEERTVLEADPMRVAQVFSNLLNNAAQYTPRGGHISLIAERKGNQVAVSVRDNGIGIPADKLAGIFDLFSQVDRSLERSHGGLGIGLTLVRQLVELHGGRISVDSEGSGRGSTFTVCLPLADGVAEEPPAEPQNSEVAMPPKRRILVADDNEDAARSLSLMLKMLGNEVRTTHDGLAALEAAADFRPEVALLDIGMPGLNGYDVAQRIRDADWGKEMLLIALTGWGQANDKRRAIEAGFDRHCTKPVTVATLQSLIAGCAQASL